MSCLGFCIASNDTTTTKKKQLNSPVGVSVGRVQDERAAIPTAQLREHRESEVVHLADRAGVQDGGVDAARRPGRRRFVGGHYFDFEEKDATMVVSQERLERYLLQQQMDDE